MTTKLCNALVAWAWFEITRRRDNHARIRKNYGTRNLSKVRLRAAKWNRDNKQKRNLRLREWMRARSKTNVQYRLGKNLRTRIWWAMKAQMCRSKNVVSLLGCSVSELKQKLETQFTSGMTWENYGSFWEIDHKTPCISFDLADPLQKQKCFHFSNLQPLSITANRSKGAKV